MATAPLKIDRQAEKMSHTRDLHYDPAGSGVVPIVSAKPKLSTLLVVMLAVLLVVPFVTRFLPYGLREYLDVLFR